MQSAYRCVAGIDVHKKMLAVVVRREENGQVEYEKRKFGTTRSEIEHLAAWLQKQRVEEVVMESTAQYWRPVWYGLEAHFRLHLCHPLKVRAPRGRKRDYRDAQRLADRWWSGDLEDSFIPGAEQRAWRWLTRTRVQLKRLIGVVRNRVEGLLEQGGIKLTAVASDPFGVSGWAMLKLLAKGETDVAVLAAEARGRLRKKEAQLQEALAGKLDPVYRMLLRQNLEQVELLRRQIEEVNEALAESMKAHTAVNAPYRLVSPRASSSGGRLSSIMTQGLHRVDAGSAPRGLPGGRKSSQNENGGGQKPGGRVICRHAV